MKRVCVLLAVIVIILVAPAPVRAGFGTISVSGTYDIGSFGNDSVITINGGLTVTLTDAGGLTYTNMQIVCGSNVTLMLNGVKIDDSSTSGACPLSIGSKLILEGDNILRAGQYQPAVKVESPMSLEISGSGMLEAAGGFHSAGIGGGDGGAGGSIAILGGTVNATGGVGNLSLSYEGGAGIGGGYNGEGGTVTISGGTVTATGKDGGAGIGGGFGGGGGTVNISSGTVTAAGGNCAAGIGGGCNHSGGAITISGGMVTAQGGSYAAGVGGGANSSSGCDGGTLTISGGTVNATGGANGAGVGGGSHGAGGAITIENGTVIATGGSKGAGIGGGDAGAGGTITVKGGEITAVGMGVYDGVSTYYGGAGIGGGSNGGGGTVTVESGVVDATGGYCAAGIGGGDRGNGGIINISGGQVEAAGGNAGAGIGGGDHGNGGMITISGGQVGATGGNSGAGIGGGLGGSGGTIVIGNGTVNATGGEGGAGIGGGVNVNNGSSGGTITLTGGTVTVQGGNSGAGIGGGAYGNGGAITIGGGQVDATGGSQGAGIGGGRNGSGDTISIEDGIVTATGGSDCPGIGGGFQSSGGIITIKSGMITAQGTDAGAGIGGAYAGSSGMITIEGGTVNATGGSQGAGIGCGKSVHNSDTIMIKGGRVAAYGGPYGAGIGCGFQSAGGTVMLFGGVIYAQKGPFAMNDIGDNYSGDISSIMIAGDAAVFLSTDHCTTPSTSHTHTMITSVAANKVYGVSVIGWNPPFGAYIVPYTLSYNLNGGTGTVLGSVTQHINTTAAIESGNGLKRNGGAFISWNTAADGSGTTYTAGDGFTFSANTTLYAQYPVMVSDITVTSGSDTVVKTKALQMSAAVLPADAADKSYTWSVENGTGCAVIDGNGLLTGTAAGTVTVKAMAKDGSGVSGTKGITVMPLLASGVTVTSGSDTLMRTQLMQISATVLPADADDKSCTWSVENGTGKAVINSGGLLTGTAPGTVTVKATANDGSGVSGTKEITVTPLLVTISESGTYDVGVYGNDSVIVINEGLTVKLTDTSGAMYANMQIDCGTGVKLTIDGIRINDSSKDNVCPLSFAGSGNRLILEGNSILSAGSGQPGIMAESGTSLEISGFGVLEAQGGFHGAGIGGGDGNGCGAVTLSGGVIYAQRGDGAPYDIGNGYSGSAGTISIAGTAAVFLRTDSCITPATSHTHETITSVADNNVYGVPANGWVPPFGIYMIPYTLSYNLNGGTGTVPGSVTRHVNTTTAVSSGSGISRTHYTLSGWNTTADGSGTGYNAGGSFTFAANTVLYAKWTPDKHMVSFNASGGSVVGSISADYGTKITAPVAPVKTGYSFAGWYKEPGYLNAWDFDSDTVPGDITLYAKWTINNYTLSYNTESAGTLKGVLKQTVSYGGYGTEVTVIPKAHYHFVKWSDGVTTESRTDTNVSRDISVTAQFALNNYNVVFEDYDGTVLKKQYVAYGEDAKPPEDPERAGYSFTGWNGDYYFVTESMTITAQYQAKTFKVTFVDYDGTIIKAQNVSTGGSAEAPVAPEREGYTFTGWDKSSSNITMDMTIMAQYKVNTYKVTFKDYDGSVIDTQNVEYGKDANAPASPERKGFIFAGWDGDYTNVKSDVTITVKYTAEPKVADVETKGDEATVTLDTGGLNITGASVEGGEATVNRDGTVTLKFPDGIKPRDVKVTFMLADGSTTMITITGEDITAAGTSAGNTATENLPIWIWIIIGVGGTAAIVLAMLLLTRRKRDA